MLFKKKSKELEVYACANGKVIQIENVPDLMFSEKMLGDGIAIETNTGEIFSPIDGQIIMLQDSLHAIGIKSGDGIEILIHIGLDTVELKGEGFKKNINLNDRVRKGQSLITFDKKKIEEKRYNTITMMLVVDNERIIKIEKDSVIEKPLLKIQYKNSSKD